jgi:hypothetical protein
MKPSGNVSSPKEIAVAVIATAFFVIYFGGMIYSYFGEYRHPERAVAYPIHAEP